MRCHRSHRADPKAQRQTPEEAALRTEQNGRLSLVQGSDAEKLVSALGRRSRVRQNPTTCATFEHLDSKLSPERGQHRVREAHRSGHARRCVMNKRPQGRGHGPDLIDGRCWRRRAWQMARRAGLPAW